VLDDALAGRGRLVLLVGEPGIGKTRLADATAGRASAAGVPVLWGRAWEAGGAPAYWPWQQALGGACRLVDDVALARAVGDGAALLAEVVPEARGRLADPGLAPPPSPAEARFRLWRAVSGLVREAAAARGLVLILDDLHSADESSLELLHFVARELRGARALVLATYRDVEAQLAPAAGELIARIAREGTTLPLGRLDRATATSFLRQRVALAPAELDRIFASAQGNPLFLDELARLVGEEGVAALAAGRLPRGVREAIRQRLERVPEAARPLVEVAAVGGDEVDGALIGAVAATATVDLAGAVRAGVLVDRGAGRLRFSHALVREVVYRELPAERRRALHGRFVAALEQLRPRDPPLAELAHHALEGPPELLGRAVELAERAAERAAVLYAHQEAIVLLERALAAVEATGNPPLFRARVLLALAEARIGRGEPGPGRALCLEAAALVREQGDGILLARAALVYGQVFTLAVTDPVLVTLLEDALCALPAGDHPVRVRLLARLGAALQPSATMAEPARVAREAIASARRLGDPATVLGALHSGISALMDFADARERLALNLEAEQLATALGDRERLLRSGARLIVDLVEIGDLAAADGRIAAFEALAGELRAPWYSWRVPLFRSMRALMHGRFAEAEEHLRQVEARAGDDPEIPRTCLFHREGLLRAAERHGEMIAFDPLVRRPRSGLFRAAGWLGACSATTAARVEDVETARVHLELIPPELKPFADNAYALFFLAEPVALVGTPDEAARAHALLEPQQGRDVVMGLTALLWEGPVARLLALLAVRLGRWDEASARFTAALERLERLDARPYLARTRYELGRSLLVRGRPEDREAALRHLGAAREAAQAMGMAGLHELAARRLAALGVGATAAVAPAAPPPDEAIPFTLVEDGELWAVGFRGQSFRLKDSLGLRYLARLVAEPDREVHVLELARAREGGDEGAVDSGDAGELLDDEARETYRRRLEDLRETVAEAESFGDQARAARAREEIDFLAGELGRAVGLGGRARRAGGATERARSAVQRRIKNAIERIADQAPALAAYLGRTVRTGIFCSFRPTTTTTSQRA
jgi:hypothetical protein